MLTRCGSSSRACRAATSTPAGPDASSELTLGDVLVAIGAADAKDRAVAVYAPRGLRPLIRMPAGSRELRRTTDEWVFEHPRTGEQLELYIDEVAHELAVTTARDGDAEEASG